MKFFHIQIAVGLITADHKHKMDIAIWEFMWLLDRVTKIDNDGNGWVLGGKPIKLEDISKYFKDGKITTWRHLQTLAKNGYILLNQTPYGLGIKVCKAKKFLNLGLSKMK